MDQMTTDRLAYNPENHKGAYANRLVACYNAGLIKKNSGLHVLAIKAHHGMTGEHDVMTDLRIHLGMEDASGSEIGKAMMPLTPLVPDMVQLISWLNGR